MSDAPFLSITLLNYNYARYLAECLDGILGQTMGDFELIVIDDCSKDDSAEVVKPYLADPRVRYIRHETNQGFMRSLVEGCELSRGKYITVISADDLVIDPEAFALARKVLDANPEVTLCYSAWYQIDGEGNITYERGSATHDYVVDGIDELRRLLISTSILHTGTLIRRDAYHEVGGYDQSLRFAVDANMWLAICTTGKVAYIHRPLYAYRVHGNNMSSGTESFWKTTEEMCKGIDDALARVPLQRMPDKERQRRMAKQRALVSIPTVDIFSGRYRRGWEGYWLALKQSPGMTVLQPRTVTLLVRTLIGMRGFELIRKVRRERNVVSEKHQGDRRVPRPPRRYPEVAAQAPRDGSSSHAGHS